MAAEWRFEYQLEEKAARRVCARVYETLQEAMEFSLENHPWDAAEALSDLQHRLRAVLPFDPEEGL